MACLPTDQAILEAVAAARRTGLPYILQGQGIRIEITRLGADEIATVHPTGTKPASSLPRRIR